MFVYRSSNEPPSTDVSNEAIIKSDVIRRARVPRRKFIWDDEMR